MAASRRPIRGATSTSATSWIRLLAGLSFLAAIFICLYAAWPEKQRVTTKVMLFASSKTGPDDCNKPEIQPVLVSYSYFEKDEVQKANMEFFLALGLGYSSGFRRPTQTDFVIVISGDKCSPCEGILPQLTFEPAFEDPSQEVAKLWTGAGITVLQRVHNEGMDFAAHNVSHPLCIHRNADVDLVQYTLMAFHFCLYCVRGLQMLD